MRWKNLGDWLMLLCICVMLVAITYAVFDTLGQATGTVSASYSSNTSIHLPTKCAEFYNSGTDEWKECMQVGYK